MTEGFHGTGEGDNWKLMCDVIVIPVVPGKCACWQPRHPGPYLKERANDKPTQQHQQALQVQVGTGSFPVPGYARARERANLVL